jgi:uncharacterized protein involved in outer membrane biogenesis
LKRILYGLTAATACLLGALFLVPRFISLESYKPILSAHLEKSLGRRLTIDGPIHLSLLPSPSVVVEKIHLENAPGASHPHMIDLPKARLEMAVAPLFHKTVRLDKVQFFHPTLYLETLPQGKNNWEFSPQESLEDAADAATKELSAKKGLGFDLAFDKVEVLNAELHYLDDAKKDYKVEDLTANVTMESLQGPLSATGVFQALGKNVQFNFNLKGFKEKAPLRLVMTTRGAEITMKGDLVFDTQTFQGDIRFASDIDDLEEIFTLKTGTPDFLREAFVLTGYAEISPKGMTFQHLEVTQENTSLEGSAGVELSPLRFSADLRGLPGGIHLKTKATPDKNGLSGHLDLSVKSPRKLLKWARMGEDQSLPSHLVDKSWNLSSNFSTEKDHVRLSGFSFSCDQVTFKGDLGWDPVKKEMGYNVHMLASPTFLTDWDLPQWALLKDISFKGKTKIQKQIPLTFATHTDVSFPSFSLGLKGSISTHEEDGPLVTLETAGTLSKPYAVSEKMILSSGHFSTDLRISGRKTMLSNLKSTFHLDGHPLTLGGQLTLEKDKHLHVGGSLSLSPLAFKDEPAPRATKEGPHSKGKTPHKAPSSSAPTWSKDLLDLSFLTNIRGSLTLAIPSLQWSDLQLNDVTVTQEYGESETDLSLAGKLWGGTCKAALKILPQTDTKLTLRLSLENASLKDSLEKIVTGPLHILAGDLDLTGNLTTHGQSIHGFVSRLSGILNVRANKGVIGGFDLKALSAGLNNIRDIKAFGNLLSGNLSQGKTTFSSSKLVLDFKDGVGRVGALEVVADGATLTGTGVIDLLRYVMDLSLTATLTDHPRFPPFQITLKGPLNDPKKSYDVSALQGYLIENIFTTILKSPTKISPKALLQGLIPGTGDEGTSSTPSDQDQKKNQDSPAEEIIEKPAKALGGLLKGLF